MSCLEEESGLSLDSSRPEPSHVVDGTKEYGWSDCTEYSQENCTEDRTWSIIRFLSIVEPLDGFKDDVKVGEGLTLFSERVSQAT